MGNTDIWMPIYIGDYLKDTKFLSFEEHGAYFIILMELWTHGGYIEKKKLFRVVSSDIWENISDYFIETDGKITQKRLLVELEKANNRSKSAKTNALKRWQCDSNAPALAMAMQNGMPNTMRNGCSSPSSSHSQSNTKRKNKHFFQKSEFYDKKILSESLPEWTSEMIDYYWQSAESYSKANGAKYLDWRQALMNWQRRDQKEKKGFYYKNPNIPEPPPSQKF